jgi:hypothetical protein
LPRINEADSTEPDEHLDVDSESFPETGAADGPEPRPRVDHSADLPHERAVEPPDDADAVLEELLTFYSFGDRGPAPSAQLTSQVERPLPALLHPYLELSRVRHDYPVCFVPGPDGDDIRPLTRVIDGLVEASGMEGDEVERLRRQLQRLEREIRELSDNSLGASLLQLWDVAAEKLLDDPDLDDEKRKILSGNLEKSRGLLAGDGEVVSCRENVAPRVFAEVSAQRWRRRCEEWRSELDVIAQRLDDILKVDSSHSPQARSPETLRSSTGDDEMDFQAMSELLGDSHLGDRLPDARRERIRQALDIIRLVQPLFEGDELHADAPISADAVAHDPRSALEHYSSRMKIMTDFFRAVRIGRIEMANGYREEVHDEFFDGFDASYLTGDELALCPPILVVINQRALSAESIGELTALFNSGVPAKVLVVLDDLLASGLSSSDPSLMTGWVARLAGMMLQLNHTFVQQCTVASLDFMAGGFAAGYDYDGPALFSIYTGSMVHQPGLPLYLNASLAVESRAFPSFRYDPAKGPTWADRMDVSDNPDAEAAWPTDTFAYRVDDERREVELSFTLGDFLFCDRRLAHHFLTVGPEKWHENMVPFAEFIDMDDTESERRVPYLTAVDANDEVCRTVPSRLVASSAAQTALYWRSTRELGGVDNSHAQALLSREGARLEEDMAKRVEELEQKYQADLERDLGELTQEIVQRIASQLLTEGTSAAAAFTPRPATAPAPTPAQTPAPATADESAEAAPAAEAEEDDDDVVTLDEPYIDTPLCTSCNDCFKINDRAFAYDQNKQAFIKDASAATYRELVMAAEACPVKIIHPGKPQNPDEPGLDELIKRAEPFM